MTITFSTPQREPDMKPRITVVGIGGAGGNAVNNMISASIEGVEFVVANTDAQSLAQSLADRRLQLGKTITQGLGAGARPDVGRAAAEETIEEIVEALQGSNMVFVAAGMGGGTGTGAAPVIAAAAREAGILTVGVVTKPFQFEGNHRMRTAEAGILELEKYVDTLIIIPNQNLFRVANEKTTFADAFKMADDVLCTGVRGVTDLMVMPGLINLDFADIRTVMGEMGKAMMGTGQAEGDNRARAAAEAAISNPLLEDASMKGAKGVLINITGSMDMTLFEVDEAANRIRSEVDPDANIIVGSTFNQELEGRVRVSVVATGIDTEARQAPKPAEEKTVVAVSKPWREPAPAPAVSYNPAPAPVRADPAPLLHASGANPVGDVHERIRRMLTEGVDTAAEPVARRMQAAPAPAVEAPRAPSVRPASDAPLQRNPFRDAAQTIGKTSIEAALDMFKAIGGGPAPRQPAPRPPVRHEPAPRAPEAARAPQPQRGDLFDDGADAELEIPAFLRKKKTG